VRTRLFTIKEGIYIKFNNLLAPKGAQKGGFERVVYYICCYI